MLCNITTKNTKIGEKMMDHIIKYAKNQVYKTIQLSIIDTNPKAQKLYENKGFKVKSYTNIKPLTNEWNLTNYR